MTDAAQIRRTAPSQGEPTPASEKPRAPHDASAPSRAETAETDVQLLSNISYGGRWKLAGEDLSEGFRLSKLFRTLGWLDIKTRYRGSVLGPFWLTLSTAILVTTLGLVYSQLYHIKLHDFLPYIAISITLWNFLNSLVTDGCIIFTQSESTIRSMRMPYFVFAGQSIYRNILILAHNLAVIVVVFAIFRIWPGLAALATLPALLLWLVDAFAISMLLGAFCARFRDVPPIVASVMQIAFYVSPVIWKPDMLPPDKRGWLAYDPFYTLFEIVRAPLLGALPSREVWLSAGLSSLALCVIAWVGFVRIRSRIAFWI